MHARLRNTLPLGYVNEHGQASKAMWPQKFMMHVVTNKAIRQTALKGATLMYMVSAAGIEAFQEPLTISTKHAHALDVCKLQKRLMISLCRVRWASKHAPLTSNEYRLQDGLFHRGAGYEISVVQHISRKPLQFVPDCRTQGGHSLLQTAIGTFRRVILDSDIKQPRCSRAGHLLLGPD